MSNPVNRGRILWVAATNRADIIDDALLRRFDRVIPLLPPDVSESTRIFATMLETISKQSGDQLKVVYGGDLAQSERRDGNGRLSPTQQDLNRFLPISQITAKLGLTGAGIEIVVRRAIEIACEEMIDRQAVPSEQLGAVIETRHLSYAVQDFKPNHNRASYEYQSLLALRACNFYSVIPTLPQSGVYGRIQRADGTIDPEKLEEELHQLELRISRA
jgi:SpoVK/Ycf46/Vps4 family AAA+-type ATPase